MSRDFKEWTCAIYSSDSRLKSADFYRISKNKTKKETVKCKYKDGMRLRGRYAVAASKVNDNYNYFPVQWLYYLMTLFASIQRPLHSSFDLSKCTSDRPSVCQSVCLVCFHLRSFDYSLPLNCGPNVLDFINHDSELPCNEQTGIFTVFFLT